MSYVNSTLLHFHLCNCSCHFVVCVVRRSFGDKPRKMPRKALWLLCSQFLCLTVHVHSECFGQFWNNLRKHSARFYTKWKKLNCPWGTKVQLCFMACNDVRPPKSVCLPLFLFGRVLQTWRTLLTNVSSLRGSHAKVFWEVSVNL